MSDVNPAMNPATETASEAMLCLPWVVFASGQGLRAEYGTTASASIGAALEEEVSALCREFHNALGVQEVPEGLPVVLFWKANQSPHWIVTQVLGAPRQAGERIAYEYFSLALTEDDLHRLNGNPLRALEMASPQELRQRCIAGLREPVCVTVTWNPVAGNPVAPNVTTSQFAQGGTWPATAENREALLATINSGGAATRSFATWWPGARPPRSGAFDIVLLSDATRVARPHEILAVAAELNHSLSRSLPAPPSYDTVGGRFYRTLLHGADEVQAMLSEAYGPAALEESPHRWMVRPQKVAGLCQKIAVDLPDYAARLPSFASDDSAALARQCTELAGRYEDLARELQKLRHPNILHQSQNPAVTGAATGAAESSKDGAPGAGRSGMQLALVLGCLLAFGLLGLGVRTLVGGANTKPHTPGVQTTAPSGSEAERRDQEAIALMQARAQREVFRVAEALTAGRARAGQGLSKDAMQSIVVDAVAQAMTQTPHSQIKPAQKQLLFRLATATVRARAMEGVRAGARQRGSKGH